MPGIAHAMEGALLMQRIYDFDFYEHDEDISKQVKCLIDSPKNGQ